ncbi:hypothetical protein K6U06_02410 [Acidiferrimicrobium sp. IK]|uniref:hypothetical protein n=1 Tax=Acidiferrimicrobium sp. IK TaxID=2871700 RepID=UPI0021CB746F|nr:hypothetical protein [Acidiferrimicrobium sp. IK]MCU4183198.1 hypothetical protein [Acidiferrimicrobium sp. IK]
MLTSISPLGERARHNRWSITVAWYVAASVAAAAAMGTVLGAAGSALAGVAGAPARAGVLGALAALAVVIDGTGAPVPGPRRQVDEDWLNRYRGWVYGAGFGAQLGAGVTTIVTTATVWLYLAAALLSGSWLPGAMIGATFGLVRALPLVGAGRVRSFAGLQRRHGALVRMAPVATGVTVGATAVAAVGLGVVAAVAAVAGGFS